MAKIQISLGDVTDEHLMKEIIRRKTESGDEPEEFEWELDLTDDKISVEELQTALRWWSGDEEPEPEFKDPAQLIKHLRNRGIPDKVFRAFEEWALSPTAHLDWNHA